MDLFLKMLVGLLSFCTIGIFCESLVSISKGPIKCIFVDNHPCQARPTLVDINSDETLFYQFAVSVNKCGGSCNTIDDSYAWVWVRNKAKNMNVKVFNLISELNETKFLAQHESRKCKSGWNEMNHDECWCECKRLDDWSSWKDDYMWNLSTCDCECNKEKRKKRLIGKVVSECEDEISNTTETLLHDKKVSWKKIIVLFIQFH